MTDTHTHLYMAEDFPGSEGNEAVKRAIDAGVHTLIMPNVDTASIRPILEMRDRFPQNVYAAMGLHPSEVKDTWREDLQTIKPYVTHPGVVALGEIGMDLYWETTREAAQREALAEQLKWAAEHKLPLIIHQRGALPHTLEMLQDADLSAIPGMVFHCFTEDEDSVAKIREVVPDTYFGIGGVSTFKNAPALRKALHAIGIDRIVLETDAPWLAPVPHRGTRNESAYIPLIAQTIATEVGFSFAEVCDRTDANARALFRL